MSANENDRHERFRAVTWSDPSVHVEAVATRSGKEFLRAIANGELPPSPVARLLGYRVKDIDDGYATVELEPAEHLYNPICTVHGGVLCTLLDTAMGCAVHTKLAARQAYVTLGITASFIRPVTVQTGLLRGEGRIIHLGSTIATAEGKILDCSGKLYAHATSTFTILSTKT